MPQPFVHLHLFDCADLAAYRTQKRPSIQRWWRDRLERQEEWIIMYCPRQPDVSEAAWSAVLEEPDVAAVINHDEGYADGIAYDSPVIHTAAYLQFLEEAVRSAGGTRRHKEVNSVRDAVKEALAAGFDMLVNATGMAAGKLAADDECFPCFGQIIAVDAPEAP